MDGLAEFGGGLECVCSFEGFGGDGLLWGRGRAGFDGLFDDGEDAGFEGLKGFVEALEEPPFVVVHRVVGV